MNRPGTKSSRTCWGQNLHKLSGDKIKCLIIGISMNFNFQFQLTFLGLCNVVMGASYIDTMCDNTIMYVKHFYSCVLLEIRLETLCHCRRLSPLRCIMSQPMRLWYLSHRRQAMALASLCIRVVSPVTSLFVQINYASRRWVRPK